MHPQHSLPLSDNSLTLSIYKARFAISRCKFTTKTAMELASAAETLALLRCHAQNISENSGQ
jgi:hypothetical protein